MTDESVASRVKAARMKRGWSVEQAAREAGVNRVTYKRVEAGEPVREDSLHKVVAALLPGPVGADDQDAAYVAAPGDRVDDPKNITMADLMDEIRAVRRELDEIRRRESRP